MKEIDRIREVYRRRDHYIQTTDRYTLFNVATLSGHHSKERELLDILKRNDLCDLSEKMILDVGCGTGKFILQFVGYGAIPDNCYGIDLIENRIESARARLAGVHLECGNAETLSYNSNSFDIILSFTVFSSVLDSKMRDKIASEMIRVLKNDGIIIWYDFHMNNPGNPDVIGIKMKEIRRLFPGCKIDLKRTTLAPPLSRRLASFSVILCQLLEKLPILCTHYQGFIRKGPANV